MEISSGVVRIKDEQGQWRDVDLSLARRADGSVASRVHPYGLVLSGATGEGEHDLAVLGKGEEQVTLGWRGRLPEPVLDGARATYVDVRPGVDLVVEVRRSGYESFLVVKNRSAVDEVASLEMPLRAAGLTAKTLPNGAVDLVDKAGKVRAGMAEPFMWDAGRDRVSGEPAKRRRVGAAMVANTADGAGNQIDLVLTPDRAFLDDPDTEYPVTIDPEVWIQPYGLYHDTWVQSDGQAGWASPELKIGTFDGGWTVARSYIWWDEAGIASVFGAHINWATLSLWEFWAWSCRDADWFNLGAGYFETIDWWSQPPSYFVAGQSDQTVRSDNYAHQNGIWDNCGDADGDWVGMDVTGFVQTMADNRTQYATELVAEEWNNDGWKRFNSSEAGWGIPQIYVNVNALPSVTGRDSNPSMACATGPGRPHVSSIPQLRAVINDPEGAQVSAQFEWWPTGGSSALNSGTVSGASGSWLAVTPHTQDLPDGGDYSWRVRASDGFGWSDWSGWCEFHLDSQAPSAMSTVLPSPCMNTPSPVATGSLPRLNTNNGGAGLKLRARVNDINGGTTRAQFEWMVKGGTSAMGSVTTPSPGLPIGSTFEATVAAGTFTSGQAYGWRARGNDGGFDKPWSRWCEFVADMTPPGLPTVSAAPGNDLRLAVYTCNTSGCTNPTPQAPLTTAVVGRPTRVRFAPAGGTDPEIVRYAWGINTSSPDHEIQAGPDGTAVVTIEPSVGGFAVNQLTVLAIDRAGNRSALPSGLPYMYGFRANASAGWWPTTASGGSSVTDITSNAHNLTLNGGASLGNGRLTLNGSTGQAATSTQVLTTTNAYTVAAWARPTALSGDQVVLSQDGSTASGFQLMYRSTPRAWCFVAPTTNSATPSYVEACAPAATATVNTWTHLAGTYDSSAKTISLYVNGSLVDTVAFTNAWSATGVLVAGRGKVGGAAAGWFGGSIADIRTWQRVVDATGLAALAQRSPDIPAGAVSRQDLAARFGVSAPPATSMGPYALYNYATGKCADLPGGGPGTINGGVYQWSCNFSASDNMLWNIEWYDNYRFTVRNPDDGFCLDAPGTGVVGDGTPIAEYICLPADDDNQSYWAVEVPGQTGYWFVNGKSVLVAGADRSHWLCLEVSGQADGLDGNPLLLYPCQAANDDHFWGLASS